MNDDFFRLQRLKLFKLMAFYMLFVGQVSLAQEVCPKPEAALKNDMQLKIIGVARGYKGEFLYCEYHYHVITPDSAREWLVEYTRPEADVIIAKKTLTYRAFDEGLIAPAVDQIDYRTGELRRAIYTDEAIEFSYRESKEENTKTQKISRQLLPVVDAGFDHFVRLNWQKLAAGSPVVFEFGSIAHLRSIELRAIKKPLTECDAGDSGFLCLHVQANNRFLRFFVGELALVYDEQRRLKLFKGAVNLQGDNAKSLKAVINYSYL